MKPSNYEELEKAIVEMEALKAFQKQDLKNHFQLTKQSLKPANLVKNALGETVSGLTQPGGLGNLALKAGGALAAGLLAKNLLAPRLAGAALGSTIGKMAKAGAATLVANNSDKVFAYGKAIISNLFTGKKKKAKQLHNGVHV
ncbi:MAG: hypothetical protein WAT19_15780 [Ferruginibacter sp.]